MTATWSHDTQTRSLTRLMAVRADPERAARVRHACRQQLTRTHQRTPRRTVVSRVASRIVAAAVLTACAVYAALLVAATLRLEAALR